MFMSSWERRRRIPMGFGRAFGRAFGCQWAFGRTSGQTSGRTVVGGARVVSGAEKKSFDRGGPVWPPRSNVTNDRLRGGSGGALPPQSKTGGSGGQRPLAKNILTWRTLFTKTIDANKWHAAK